MKVTVTLLFLALLAPSASLARGLQVPSPDPEQGTIALGLKAKAKMGSTKAAIKVYFVRVDDDTDPLQADSVIQSNFFDAKQVYLLNCPPGRYVVVGAELTPARPINGPPMDFTIVLDRQSIPRTEIVVHAGELVFGGNLLLDSKNKLTKADETQAHFLRLLEPGQSHRGYMARAMSGTALWLGSLISLDRGEQAEREFFEVATRKAFKKYPEWQETIRQHQAP